MNNAVSRFHQTCLKLCILSLVVLCYPFNASAYLSSVVAFISDDIKKDSEHVTVVRKEISDVGNSRMLEIECAYSFRNMSNRKVDATFVMRSTFPLSALSAWDGKSELKVVEFRDLEDRPHRRKKTDYFYVFHLNFDSEEKKNTVVKILMKFNAVKGFRYFTQTDLMKFNTIDHVTYELRYDKPEEMNIWLKDIKNTQYLFNGDAFIWKYDNISKPIGFGFKESTFPLPEAYSREFERLRRFINNRVYSGDSGYYGNRIFRDLHDEIHPDTAGNFSRHNIVPVYLRILRNEIYARHGKAFESEDLRSFFESMKWYNQDPGFHQGLLNDTERRNVESILDKERGIEKLLKSK